MLTGLRLLLGEGLCGALGLYLCAILLTGLRLLLGKFGRGLLYSGSASLGGSTRSDQCRCRC